MIQLPPWVRLPRGVRWSRTLGIASAATLVLGCFALWALSGLMGSIFTFGSSSDPSQSLADALKRHDQLALADLKRFDGRSAFYMPSAPVRKAPKPVKPPEPPKPPPPPPPPAAPREYTGPKVAGAIGDTVYFADSSQAKVGEEHNGVKVLASSPPWSVRLAHAGGEYDVPLWTRWKADSLDQDWRSTKAATPGVEVIPGDKKGANQTPAGTSASASPASTPPGAPAVPPQPVVVPPPGPDTADPATRSGPGMGPPGGRAPAASSGTLTGDAPVPAPLAPDRIASMTRGELQAAYRAVMAAKGSRIIDDATRERLNQESQQLADRLKDVSKGQSGPR